MQVALKINFKYHNNSQLLKKIHTNNNNQTIHKMLNKIINNLNKNLNIKK